MSSDAFAALLRDFLLESRERLQRVEQAMLELGETGPELQGGVLDEARRELHTLKGNSGMMGLVELQELAHHAEDLVGELEVSGGGPDPVLAVLDEFGRRLSALEEGPGSRRGEKSAPAAEPRPVGRAAALTGVRVPFERLDELVEILAQIVIAKNRLGTAVAGASRRPDADALQAVEHARIDLTKVLDLLQDRVLRLRMVPLQSLLPQLRRIVHDEARRTGRRARFVTAGGETTMDKALLEVASDALGHLVRNAVVHGLEEPAERERRGKDAEGLVRVSAGTTASEVVIVVADDGAGIDAARLIEAASERHLSPPVEGDPYSVLFVPGFTTRASADTGSGRGMGLAAVQAAVRRVGGRVEVESAPGKGTRFRLRLPLSVSITRAMIVQVEGESYAVPVGSIIETRRLAAGESHEVNHALVMRWRGSVIPLLDLGAVFADAGRPLPRSYVIVLETDRGPRGLLVDELGGMQEIVVKALDELAGRPRGVSGSTILGDGRVILILDPAGLALVSPIAADPGAVAGKETTR